MYLLIVKCNINLNISYHVCNMYMYICVCP